MADEAKKVLVGNIKGPKGDKGEDGSPGARGAQGIQGEPGPNLVNGDTATTLNGVLFGDGSKVTAKPMDEEGGVASHDALAAYLQKVTQEMAGKLSATESAEYPGCYYRTVSGVTEWLNPPLAIGAEYRTTERYNGKPVYRQIKTIYTCVGNETGRYVASITADVAQVVDCKIKQLWSDIGSNSGMFIPGYSETTGEMDGLNCTVYWGNGHIYMRLYFAAKPTAGYQIMCDVKYTKTTD